MENIRTRDIGRGIGFFGKESFLSNRHPARFCMNEHRFLNSEQAFYYYKGIICGRENTGNEIKKMINPGEIKNLGDQIPTCDEWEKRKFKVMNCVLTHKFEQNRALQEKLVNTGTRPLIEGSTDLFWGAGWVIDSEKWDEPLDYPGQNNLGKILEIIRENYLPLTAPFDPTANPGVIQGQRYTSTPMVKSSKKRKNSKSTDPPSKQAVVHLKESTDVPDPTKGGKIKTSHSESATKADDPATSASVQQSQTAGVSSEGAVQPTHGISGPEEGQCPVEQEKEWLTESQVMEIDELTFSDTLYQSYDAKNVTNKDGSLNVDKIRSWGLPALNTSRLMEGTGFGTDEPRHKLSRLLSAQNAGESFVNTDPRGATPVETVTRKTLVANRQTKTESE